MGHRRSAFSTTQITMSHVNPAENAFQAKLLENVLDAICAVDNQLVITYWNKMAEEMLGWTSEEAVGKPFLGLMKTSIPDEIRKKRFRDIVTAGYYQGEMIVYHKGGKVIYADSHIRITRDTNGKFSSCIVSFRDVTSRKLAEEELKKSKELATDLVEKQKKADENKDKFISILSHELRNPLASIKMGISLLHQVPPGGEQAMRAMAIIQRQILQLSSLADDLLDVTRINQNKIELKKKNVNIHTLIHQIAIDNRPQFDEKGVVLKTRLAPEPLILELDPARMTQAIGNLLHNAAKYTNKGGRVIISLNFKKDEAEISVQDNGIGIKPELLPYIFEPFQQGDKTLDRRGGGLGLGLAIVKGIVELHGGSVEVASEGVGKGAQFTIKIPVKNRLEMLMPDRAPGKASSYQSLRILIIEDNEDFAEVLREMLVFLGHESVITLNGIQALEMLKRFRPDVIICDIGLPGINGYEVARYMRIDPKLKDIFLIALSGYAGPNDLEDSQVAGFDLHLKKPVEMNQLKNALADPKVAATKVKNTLIQAGHYHAVKV